MALKDASHGDRPNLAGPGLFVLLIAVSSIVDSGSASAATVTIDGVTLSPGVVVPAGDRLVITETGVLDTGTFGSVRAVDVVGELENSGALLVGFSSESAGLQIAGSALNGGGLVTQPDGRITAAMGAITPSGLLVNQGVLVTGAYPVNSGPLTAAPGLSSLGIGLFGIAGTLENAPSGDWTNHGDLLVTGTVVNQGRFETRNAPAAIPATSLPYAQVVSVGAPGQTNALLQNQNLFIVAVNNAIRTSGTFENAPGGVLRLEGGRVEVSGQAGQVGSFRQAAGAETRMTGGASLDIEAGAVVENAGSIFSMVTTRIANAGLLENQAGGVIEISAGRLDQSPNARIENSGQLLVAGVGGELSGGEFVNRGSVGIDPDGTISVGSFEQQSGRLVVNGELGVDGSIPGAAVLVYGGVLAGSGTINGDVFLQGSGPSFQGDCSQAPADVACFTPGNSPGSMTINGQLTLGQFSILELEIERDESGQLLFDEVSASGLVFEPGSQIRILLGSTVGEISAPLNLLLCTNPELPCSFAGDVDIFGGSADLELTTGGLRISSVGFPAPVPVPAAVWLLASGLGGLGVLRRRRGGTGAERSRARPSPSRRASPARD